MIILAILFVFYLIFGLAYGIELAINIFYVEEKDGLNIVDIICLIVFLPQTIVVAAFTGIILLISLIVNKIVDFNPNDIIHFR